MKRITRRMIGLVLSVFWMFALTSTFNYSQTPEAIAVSGANLQRTGLFESKGVHTLHGIIWKSPKLFSIEEKVRPFQDEAEVDLFVSALGLHHFVSTPVFSNGAVFFSIYNGNGFLAAFDARTGERRWVYSRQNGMISPPIIVGDSVYVGAGARTIVSLDANSGKEIARFSGETPPKQGVLGRMRGDRYSPTPIVAHNLLLIGGAEGRVFAVDRKLTTLQWSLPVAGTTGTPAVANNTAYVGTSLGFLYAINLADGTKRWEIKRKVASPMVSGDRVFFGEQSTLYAVDAANGQEKWKARTPARIGTPLAAAYETIYFAGEEANVYAVDFPNGRLKWQFKTEDSCAAPVISDGIVYASCKEHLFALEAKSGAVIWEFKDRKVNLLSPVVIDDMLCLLSEEGFLFALH